jgi:hypothetical protein
MRFALLADAAAVINNNLSPYAACAGNVLDPIVTGLMVLATKGIERETIAASEKLQKARRRSNKPPIPSYDRVNTALYVTAWSLGKTRVRGAERGGTHASPVPHLRAGHLRTYVSGRQTFVSDTLVNVSAATRQAFKSGKGDLSGLGLNRSHYEV